MGYHKKYMSRQIVPQKSCCPGKSCTKKVVAPANHAPKKLLPRKINHQNSCYSKRFGIVLKKYFQSTLISTENPISQEWHNIQPSLYAHFNHNIGFLYSISYNPINTESIYLNDYLVKFLCLIIIEMLIINS